MRKPALSRITAVHVLPDQASSSPGEVDILRSLERRLDDGYARIEQAIARGEDVTSWEAFWIDLLRQYESAWDELPEAA